MKTKAFSILIAVLTSASMVPMAFAQRANGNFSPQQIAKDASTQMTKSTSRALPEMCVTDACCVTKVQIKTAGGRATGVTTTKTVDCKTSCKIATNDRRSVCGKGRKA